MSQLSNELEQLNLSNAKETIVEKVVSADQVPLKFRKQIEEQERLSQEHLNSLGIDIQKLRNLGLDNKNFTQTIGRLEKLSLKLEDLKKLNLSIENLVRDLENKDINSLNSDIKHLEDLIKQKEEIESVRLMPVITNNQVNDLHKEIKSISSQIHSLRKEIEQIKNIVQENHVQYTDALIEQKNLTKQIINDYMKNFEFKINNLSEDIQCNNSYNEIKFFINQINSYHRQINFIFQEIKIQLNNSKNFKNAAHLIDRTQRLLNDVYVTRNNLQQYDLKNDNLKIVMIKVFDLSMSGLNGLNEGMISSYNGRNFQIGFKKGQEAFKEYYIAYDEFLKLITPVEKSKINQSVTTLKSSQIKTNTKEKNKSNIQGYIDKLHQNYGFLSKIYFCALTRDYEYSKKCITKIKNAEKAYANVSKDEHIIFVFDDTLFGGAEDGFLVTNKKIYVHNSFEDKKTILLKQIKSLSFENDSDSLCINKTFSVKILSYNKEEADKLIELINDIKQTFCNQDNN